MSNTTAKLRRPTLKVTPSSRAMNLSTSGTLRVNRSTTRSVNASISRRSFSLAGDSKVLDKSSNQTPKHVIQVFDETGKDVTPHPLYQPDPGAIQPRQSKIFSANDTSGGTFSDIFSTVYQTTNASFAAPFTWSVFGSSSVSRSSLSTMESLNEEIEDPLSKRDVSVSLTDVHVKREETKEQIREDMLDQVVERYLTETDTIWMLDLPSVSVSAEAEEADAVRERNKAYVELCKNRLGNDKYTERSMQTLGGAPKVKEVQTQSISMVDKSVMATTWDIYDSFSNTNEANEASTALDRMRSSSSEIVSNPKLDTAGVPDRTLFIANKSTSGSESSTGVEPFVVPVDDEPDAELVLSSRKFQKHLLVMERVILENIFQPKLAAYRQLPILKEVDTGDGSSTEIRTELEESSRTPVLEYLWAFSCKLTSGRNISSMAWNKKNPDFLAVGYGQFGFRDQKPGLVCCWSLKNPKWPAHIFHCESGVTSVDFSASNNRQLAVGMYNGTISIYTIQTKGKTRVIDSSGYARGHTGPVWQVKWISQDRDSLGERKGEALISVSSDGRISKWFLRQGLDCIDLMKLKRTKNEKKRNLPVESKEKSEPKISRLAPGLCFDFYPKDSNFYLVGTEEGYIHKCPYSYNEQFLETYTGHGGPVYKIVWSPFCPDVFLSCSSDWTIQLWRQDMLTPVLGFTSVQRAVYDIQWSPKWATVFGVVNEDRVEIWDLEASILDPTIVSVARPGVKLTSLLFATETDCILVGDSEGNVSIYKLKHLTVREGTQADVLEDIIRYTLDSQ
ncbi:dynein axonemal intermediate chain 4 [Chanos chanos]|uniref:Dynein axonemal intermediate chain 4 n=1 Tax=Chanos chanos TaxID=29144 RepID=A0A6J2WTW9_CHACN|nr:WD repeat-containing protein 78 [Chanos chanos]